jgi:hypothetical protein
MSRRIFRQGAQLALAGHGLAEARRTRPDRVAAATRSRHTAGSQDHRPWPLTVRHGRKSLGRQGSCLRLRIRPAPGRERGLPRRPSGNRIASARRQPRKWSMLEALITSVTDNRVRRLRRTPEWTPTAGLRARNGAPAIGKPPQLHRPVADRQWRAPDSEFRAPRRDIVGELSTRENEAYVCSLDRARPVCACWIYPK